MKYNPYNLFPTGGAIGIVAVPTVPIDLAFTVNEEFLLKYTNSSTTYPVEVLKITSY